MSRETILPPDALAEKTDRYDLDSCTQRILTLTEVDPHQKDAVRRQLERFFTPGSKFTVEVITESPLLIRVQANLFTEKAFFRPRM